VFVLAVVLVLQLPAAVDTVAERFPANDGFVSVVVDEGSFGAFLRRLPLLPPGTPVRSFRGDVVDAPWAKAVVDLDVSNKDLQQCADSAIRLWAEYRWSKGDVDQVGVDQVGVDLVGVDKAGAGFSLHATSGDPLPWRRFAAGERPVVVNNRIAWKQQAKASSSKETFRSYLENVFMWAGSRSLANDTDAVGEVAPGDLLVKGGSPGHVLVVLDVARSAAGGERWLIGQGYMPAQSFHVLGWFAVDDDGAVTVPSWPGPFARSSRRRFR